MSIGIYSNDSSFEEYYRTEKNATPWSKQRLKELLEGQKYENGSTVVIFKELKKLDGEATANNRKAKLIFLFEWIIELTFEGIFLWCLQVIQASNFHLNLQRMFRIYDYLCF